MKNREKIESFLYNIHVNLVTRYTPSPSVHRISIVWRSTLLAKEKRKKIIRNDTFYSFCFFFFFHVRIRRARFLSPFDSLGRAVGRRKSSNARRKTKAHTDRSVRDILHILYESMNVRVVVQHSMLAAVVRARNSDARIPYCAAVLSRTTKKTRTKFHTVRGRWERERRFSFSSTII